MAQKSSAENEKEKNSRQSFVMQRLVNLRRWTAKWLFSRDSNRRIPWQIMLEITLIVLWAFWLGRDYLFPSTDLWPNGREFGMSIHPHYIWTQLTDCGTCVLWNGLYNGGSPAFTELHAAVLHPLVIVATLLWGGINGAKMIIIFSLAMAGIAQWWLAKVMQLGWVARLWAAGMAVAGGHLAGRMDIGVVGIIISTAACSLVIAPGIQLAASGKRRDVVPLAVMLALAIVSGQGYLQIGLLLSVIPAFGILLLDDRLCLKPVWREFVLAGVLALLLAGPFLVPLFHYWSEIGKSLDWVITSVQPLEYVPLNFVVRDTPFFFSEQLGALPYPYLYVNFIGWVPVLLAILPIRFAKPQERRLLTFFMVSIVLILLAGSAIIFNQIGKVLPEFVAGFRNPSLIVGLAVPLILGLAAWGVDRLLQIEWIILPFTSAGNLKHSWIVGKLSWLILFLCLLLALRTVYEYSRSWLFTVKLDWTVAEGIAAAKTSDAQWVSVPLGLHYWGPPAAEAGLKLTRLARPSFWVDRPVPAPYFDVTTFEYDEETGELVDHIANLKFVRYPQNYYAYVETDGGDVVPCTAVSKGGHINVNCNLDKPGQLIVKENYWSGWKAWQDGSRVSMNTESIWLSVAASAGAHRYQFRYRPWDVAVGVVLMGIGFFVIGVIRRRE